VTDAALSIRGLTKRFGDILAVSDLSLDVRRGEVFGLLGPNGAGKTTTIRMICGLVRPDAGEVLLDGAPTAPLSRGAKGRLGLCPQEIVVWEALTCLEQLEFVARLHGLGPSAARERARKMLEVFGLADRRRQLAGTLSGGLRRRLNIALAVVHEPELLILDEPQAGLDPQSRILVREYVRRLADGMTIVVTTHEMDEADRLSDRVAVVDHGRLLVLDTPERLKRGVGEGDVVELRIGGEAASADRLRAALPGDVRILAVGADAVRLVGPDLVRRIPDLLERLRAAGVTVADLTARQKTLEDVFIALTGRGLRE